MTEGGPPDLAGLRIDRDAPPPARNPLTLYGIVGLLLVVAIVAVAMLVVRASRAVPVNVATAEALGGTPGAGGATGGAEVLTANGYVVARQRASVSTEISGRLEALYVGEGSRVRKGEVLGVLRNQDQRTAVAASRAQLSSARAYYAEAIASREQSELELKRATELHARGLVSQAEYDAAASKVKVDRARVDRTRADVETAEAGLRVAEVDLEKTYVRAPFAGAVLRKEAEVGEIVSPIPSSGGLTRGAIVTMANLATLEVEVDVNEGYVSRAHEGMRTEIILDAYPDHRYPGRVRQIVPTADRQKATVQVKVSFDSLDARVLPEMGARVAFLADAAAAGASDSTTLSAVVTVPRAAVHDRDGRAVVFVVDHGRASERSVSPRPLGADRVAISGGLAPGEVVVLDAPSTLNDKARVSVRGQGEAR